MLLSNLNSQKEKTVNKNSTNVKLTWQLTTIVASLIYIFVMTHGYFNMFISTISSIFWTITVALIITIFAWLLAKLVAINGGIKNAVPLFVPLVLVSAAGIFNSLMLNTQGEDIFRSAVNEATSSITVIEQTSRSQLKNEEFENIYLEVKNHETAFIQELRNPVNCGLGAAANRIFADMKTILPSLTLLSGNRDCANIERIIPLYQKQINDGLMTHPLRIRHLEKYNSADKIQSLLDQAKVDSQKAIAVIESGENLIINVKPIIEKISRDYRTSAELLASQLPADLAKKVKMDLSLDAVRSIGDVTKFPKLIASRLNDMLMYFIILLAIGVDWLLVYLMRRTRELDEFEKRVISTPLNVRSGLDY